MPILRTPTERFDNLKDYPFLPHYVEVGDNLQMHYVYEGQNSIDTILMLHGKPP